MRKQLKKQRSLAGRGTNYQATKRNRRDVTERSVIYYRSENWSHELVSMSCIGTAAAAALISELHDFSRCFGVALRRETIPQMPYVGKFSPLPLSHQTLHSSLSWSLHSQDTQESIT